MNFIVIVVALLLDQALRLFEHLRVHRWYERPLAGWESRARRTPAPVQFLAALLPAFVLAFIVGAVTWGLSSASLVLGFIWALLVLMLALGPRNCLIEVSAYLKARASGDHETARQSAALLIEGEPPEGALDCAQAVSEATLLRAGDWLFSVLFWFAILGPLGAVLFRVADTLAVRGGADCPESVYARSAEALKRVMAWIPMHLLALTYAVAGSFDETLADIRRVWWNTATHFLERGDAVVAGAGEATVRNMIEAGHDEVTLLHTTVNLIWRALLIWLAVIGIITLIGWLA